MENDKLIIYKKWGAKIERAKNNFKIDFGAKKKKKKKNNITKI